MLRLSVRTIFNESYDIELPETSTLIDLRKKIEEVCRICLDDQKLIFHYSRNVYRTGREIYPDDRPLLEMDIRTESRINVVYKRFPKE